MTWRVFLAGEGPNELGRWFYPVAYRNEQRGVIESLLRKIDSSDWEVVDAIVWKGIKKYRAGNHASPERRTILGLALRAKEAGANVLAFTRDSDGDSDRQQEIESAVDDAERLFGGAVIGGPAVQVIEGWMLAIHGEHRSEELSEARAEEVLETKYKIPKRSTQAMALAVEAWDGATVPRDARSLMTWLDRARKAARDS